MVVVVEVVVVVVVVVAGVVVNFNISDVTGKNFNSCQKLNSLNKRTGTTFFFLSFTRIFVPLERSTCEEGPR